MTKHVLVVGDGVMGRCTAYFAARKGHRVTVVERNAPDHDGCSFHNAGMVSPSHIIPLASPGMIAYALKTIWNPESPFWLKPRLDPDLISWGLLFHRASTKARVERAAPLLRDLNLESRRLFEELARGAGESYGLITNGTLMLCETPKGLDSERHEAEHAQRIGVEAKVLSAREVEELEPDISLTTIGGVHYPQDAQVVPAKFMSFMGEKLREAGVETLFSTKVTGWSRKNGAIAAVRTSAGEIAADEFVVAGGSWSPEVVRDLDIRLPLQAGKGYSLTLKSPKAMPRRGLIFREARLAVTPMMGTLRIGGTMEIAGFDERVNPARVRGIIKSATRVLTDFVPADFEGIEPWMGLRPLSPDGLPYVGKFARFPNLWAATGHAMLGLSLGPITGKLMAEMLSGEPPSIPTQLLAPDRYS
jgi:D-amino-acid dehydrogenase